VLAFDLHFVTGSDAQKKRPPDKSSTVKAAIAMVGAVRTKTLVMLVPNKMRDVCTAQAASTAN